MARLRLARLFNNKGNIKMPNLDRNDSQELEASPKPSAADLPTKEDILPLLERASCRYDAIDQDRIEELSKASKQFYDQHMQMKRDARRRNMLIFACSVVAGAVYWLFW